MQTGALAMVAVKMEAMCVRFFLYPEEGEEG